MGIYLVYLFCGLAVAGGLIVLITKKLLAAAMGLLATLLSVAGLMALAGAEFAATAQIMIYAGGVVVLLVFGFMLTSDRQQGDFPALSFNRYGGAVLLFLSAYTLVIAAFATNWEALPWLSDGLNQPYPNSTISQTGVNLFTNWLLPFELVGFLLLLALVGAGYYATQESNDSE
jgi:NADH-quinone oxidoreductase subunit J